MKNDRPISKPTEESLDKPNELSAFPITTWIDNDEGAYGLLELNIQSEGSRGWHRFQIIRVTRDDQFAVWFKDMGSREFFDADQLRIASGYPVRSGGEIHYRSVDTVGELRDMANQLRKSRPLQNVLGLEPSNLIESYNKGMEYLKDRVRHPGKKVFGYGN